MPDGAANSSSDQLPRVHVLGRKNHGKTTLIVELVVELTRRGLRVGTLKHTHHAHELDTPGKDSHRHRAAGATTVGILSRGMNAVFWPPREDQANRYASFAPMFADCDIVLVEGDTQAVAPKVEVWRAAVEGAPLAAADPSIAAIITDDAAPTETPAIPRRDIAAIANQVEALTKKQTSNPIP